MVSAASEPLSGACGCGAVRLNVSLAHLPSELSPRKCDCDFCQARGLAWLSDPQGEASVACEQGAVIERLQQGDKLAEFLCCSRCQTIVAVHYEGRGAVNASQLEVAGGFAEPVVVSPKHLSAAEKLARWRQAWMPVSID